MGTGIVAAAVEDGDVVMGDLSGSADGGSASTGGAAGGAAMAVSAPVASAAAAGAHRDVTEAPVRKLTVNLIQTYKQINEVYYENKRRRDIERRRRASADGAALYNDGYDDDEYNYKISKGEKIGERGRYQIEKRIGKGSFGQVVKAYDTQASEWVGIKIIKSRKPFHKQAGTEIAILEFLAQNDPGDEFHVVRLRGTFEFRNHRCIVFELLSYNLYDLLRNTKFHGVSLNLIRKFAQQLVRSLHFLRQIKVIHCDLKPENIMLRNPKRSAIKVIDFGSSCYSDRPMYHYIQSRFYRSPEVMLGLPYSMDIDMWSLGCILVEMHTGEPLFNGKDEYDQLRRVVAVRGNPPMHMLTRCRKLTDFFDVTEYKGTPAADTYDSGGYPVSYDSGKRYCFKKTPPDGSRASLSWKPAAARGLSSVLGVETGGPYGRRAEDKDHGALDYRIFMDLVDQMLCFDPAQRIKPAIALQHHFFRSETQQTPQLRSPPSVFGATDEEGGSGGAAAGGGSSAPHIAAP